MNISSPSLRAALALSAADRRWIDFLTQTINDTWDEAHPAQPKTHGYMGSEEFIRLQFEEYLLALISCVKYHDEIKSGGAIKQPANDIEGDPALDFNLDFIEHWRHTPNFALFDKLTSDALLFSVVELRHPCAGGLGIEDIQRRLAQQVADLHLDERVREGRETLNKHLATGHQKVTTAFNTLWAELEARREAQRKRNEERAKQAAAASITAALDTSQANNNNDSSKQESGGPGSPTPASPTPSTSGWSFAARKAPAVDLTQAQATVSAAGQRASAYFSSWGSWANERRKEWQTKNTSTGASPVSSPTATGTPRASMTSTFHERRSMESSTKGPVMTEMKEMQAKEDVDRPGSSRPHSSDQSTEKDHIDAVLESDPLSSTSREASKTPATSSSG